MRSGSGGQPSHAVPTVMPSRASRTASLVRNMSVGRPDSAAPTATRKATVTFSGSSSPVVRLMTALPAMGFSFVLSIGLESDGTDGSCPRRPGFPLQIERFEAVEQAVLQCEQGGGRPGRRTGLGVDALDVSLGRLGGDRQAMGDLAGRCAASYEGQHFDLAWGETGRTGAALASRLASGGEHRVNRVRVEGP